MRLIALVKGSRQGLRDTSVSMIPQFIGLGTGFLTTIILARILGPSSLGRYALVISLTTIAGSLSDLGIGQTTIHFASRAVASGNREMQMSVLRWAFRIRIFLAFSSALIFLIAAPFITKYVWHDPGLTTLFYISLVGNVFGNLSSVPTIYFQSLKRFGINAIIASFQRIIVFIGILALYFYGRMTLFTVFLITSVTSTLASIVFLKLIPIEGLWAPLNILSATFKEKLSRFFKSPDLSSIRRLEDASDTTPNYFAFYMLLSSAILLLIMQTDVWMMGYFLKKEQLGVYIAASRFTLPLTILLNAYTTVLWPRASSLKNTQQGIELLKKTFSISIAIALICTLYSFGAPMLAPLIFGDEYSKGVLLGQLLSFRYCISILVCPIGVIALRFGFVRIFWKINLFQFVVIVALNLLFLPRIGSIASALALIAIELIGMGFVGILVWKRIVSPNKCLT